MRAERKLRVSRKMPRSGARGLTANAQKYSTLRYSNLNRILV